MCNRVVFEARNWDLREHDIQASVLDVEQTLHFRPAILKNILSNDNVKTFAFVLAQTKALTSYRSNIVQRIHISHQAFIQINSNIM